MWNFSSRRKLGPSALPFALLPFLSVAPEGAAQYALPGAIAPTPEGSVAAPADAPRRREARAIPIAPKLPSEDAILGRTLRLDGSKSSIEFQRNGANLEVARLTLEGDRLSRSGETCRIDVVGVVPLEARESVNGLLRYELNFPACPFRFEVLEGAILATTDESACQIRDADCRTDPNGLWGMGAAEFDPKSAESMVGMRARVEQTVRDAFKALYERTEKDKAARKELVREQAGFSSWREEICRSYHGEAEFGYCALRVTEARALGLAKRLAEGVKNQASSEAAKTGGMRAKRTP